MSDTIVLRPFGTPERRMEIDGVVPDALASLGNRDIAALPVDLGGRRQALGDFFDVRGERSTHVRIEGDVAFVDGLGAGMRSGSLVIEGNAGHFLGRTMQGGRIQVHGNAGNGVGSARPGASRGMAGGEIIVHGSAGSGAGARARRGTIVIRGAAADGVAHGMIAGTVIVCGDCGTAGEWSKRGSVIAMASVSIPRTYRRACTYRPSFVAVALRSLARRYDMTFDDAWLAGRYERWSGDLAELGRGEILRWVAA